VGGVALIGHLFLQCEIKILHNGYRSGEMSILMILGEGNSRWYSLNNNTAYQYLLFQINDRNGVNNYVKLSQIEVQVLSQSSTVDYDAGTVTVDYTGLPPPAAGSSLVAQFYADDLSIDQQNAVQNFILDTNHFTTQFSFSSVRMVRADLNLQVYYNPAYSVNTALNNVSLS
jgi:hypothetical protein